MVEFRSRNFDFVQNKAKKVIMDIRGFFNGGKPKQSTETSKINSNTDSKISNKPSTIKRDLPNNDDDLIDSDEDCNTNIKNKT